MHMHGGSMRTTVELSDEHRARLLALAAQRGQKGYSRVLCDTIAAGLEVLSEREHERRRERALAALGCLSEERAEEMKREVRWLREHWR